MQQHSRIRAAWAAPLAALLALAVGVVPVSGAGGWSAPAAAGALAGCADVSLALDANGARHIAAECGSTIRYLTNASGTWVTTNFGHPANRVDRAPKIAIDGEQIYVAYTRGAPEFCGIGSTTVYYRTRALEGGAWSSPIKLGNTGDRLYSFAVHDLVVHATVSSTGGLQYETTSSGDLERYILPGGFGPSSVAVGTDGVPRLVYVTGGLMRYAIFHGSGVEWQAIPGISAAFGRPQLALDADNRAHVIYGFGPIRQQDALRGPLCGLDLDSPLDGTYYVTNKTGEWTPGSNRRFTRNLGADALVVNQASGSVHVLIGGREDVKYYTKTATGSWSGVTISGQDAEDVALALNGSSGQLVAAYSLVLPDGDPGGLLTLTKP